ncbi:MAG: DUF2384 domain-containing protein [Flavobacteriales bacterium]|nr:DUF2384 domain-containing protein [Flavobacteriales bacterium]
MAVYGSLVHSDLHDLIHRVRGGISFPLFSKIAELVPFTWPEWSSFLHLSERSLQRYKKDRKSFDALQSEKIIEISSVYQRGIEVFGSRPKFDAWLSTPCVALGGPAPKSFLDSTFGIRLIRDELGRIEHGIPA